MHLPQEIIDYIVDFAHNDRPTLAALRLLNYAWNIPSSLYLFRSVDINFVDPSNLLPVSQRTFTVIDEPNGLPSLFESGTETISHCVRQVFLRHSSRSYLQRNDPAVPIHSIVSRFTHISEIVFRDIDWSTLTSSLSSYFLGICKSHALERIDFWNCSMPTVPFLDILQASSCLKTLRLIRFNIKDGGYLSDFSDSDSEDLSDSEQHHLIPSSSGNDQYYCTNITTPLLHSLTVEGVSRHLLHIFKVDKLKELHWNILKYNNGSDIEIPTEGVGQFLESLVIDFEPIKFRSELSTLQLDLSHCPRLQHLRISGLPWTWSLSNCPSTYFRSLFAQTADQPLPVERLELLVSPADSRFIICTDEKTPSPESPGSHYSCQWHQCQSQCQLKGDYGGHFCCSGWLTVDDSLSCSRIFQSLKTLHIYIQSEQHDVDLSSLSLAFPKLNNKGVEVMCAYLDDH